MNAILSSLFRGDLSPCRWLTEIMDGTDDLFDLSEGDEPTAESTLPTGSFGT